MTTDATHGGIALPIKRPGANGWEYETTAPWSVRLHGKCPDFECKWCRISNGVMTVFAPYAWDGSTAVSEGGDDPVSGLPKTCVGSGIHDPGYQFALEMARKWGWTHRQVLRFFDAEFYWLMRQWNVPRWRCGIRYAGVTLFGMPFTLASAWIRRLRGIETDCEKCAKPCR